MSTSLDYLRTRREELTKTNAAQKSFNIVAYGYVGSGKSHLLSTARQPVYVFSFDPGGTKVPALEALALDGRAILDTTYEDEDAKNPTALTLFDKTVTAMDKADAWKDIGTVCIDSLTLMADASMNYILKKEGRPGTTPQIQDYMVQQTQLTQIFRKFCNLPCDFILTGHIDTMKDEVSGRVITSLLVAGKLSTKIPALFDEVLITNLEMDAKKNPVYTVRLVGDNKYKTSTRRFSGDSFEVYEKPDIMHLRTLAGYPVEHLNPITTT